MRNARGELLIAERVDTAGAWQFPQGSLEAGETLADALRRELWEEVSLLPEHYSVRERRGPYRYLYGEGRKKKGYHGKEQHYFLVDLLGLPSCVNVATAHPEFRTHGWVAPAAFRLDWLPPMKREVYRAVLRDFFGLQL